MLQFIYVTDLHGHERHYDNLFNFSIEHNIKLVHMGADLLPKGPNMKSKVVYRRIFKKFLL